MNDEINNGYIKVSGKNGEINLLLGQYTVINNKYYPYNNYPKIVIYGLGSCIALIIYDEINKISAMSHILSPKSRKKYPIAYPHKYADLSVNLLTQKLLENGALKENLKAVIIGGSKVFDLDDNTIGRENIKSVKEELYKLNIKIVKQKLGGLIGITVKFDTNNFSVYIKTIKEKTFKKL